MAISRYKDLSILANDDLQYRKQFKSRYGEKTVLRHYETQELFYPTREEIRALDFSNHLWKLGDRYYKLAHHYYGDSKYWWAIAFFNKKPTEQHIKIGDLIKIPMPLRDVLDIYGL